MTTAPASVAARNVAVCTHPLLLLLVPRIILLQPVLVLLLSQRKNLVPLLVLLVLQLVPVLLYQRKTDSQLALVVQMV